MALRKHSPFKFTPIRVGIVVVLVLMGILSTYILTSLLASNQQEVISNGEDISYVVPREATGFQKQCYDELKVAINSDSTTEQYGLDVSSAIVKNYIADFYTWSNKLGSQDVGGLQFVYGPSIQNIYEFARAYFYHDLSYLISQYGSDNLLKVNSVTIKNVAYAGNVTINSTSYQSYYIEVSWTYESSTDLEVSTYQNHGNFSLLVNENGRYEIYRYYTE